MSEIYAITRPPEAPQAEPPPLLLLLHGFGSNEHDLMGLAPYLDERLHIVSARAIYDIGFGYAWYYLYGVPGNLQHDHASRAQSLKVLTEFVGDLPSHVGADARRVYLLGFSQGAVMGMNVALTAPHLVAGVVAISGYLDDQILQDVQADALDGLDVLVMHGSLDDLIPVSGSRALRDYLTPLPVRLTYHEYPIGHSIHPDALDVIQGWFRERVGPERPD
jgi:phospholipase/carboxylesterase